MEQHEHNHIIWVKKSQLLLLHENSSNEIMLAQTFELPQ